MSTQLGIEPRSWSYESELVTFPAVPYPDEPSLYVRPNCAAEADPELNFWFVCHEPTNMAIAYFGNLNNAVTFLDGIAHLADWPSVAAPADISPDQRRLIVGLIEECGGNLPMGR